MPSLRVAGAVFEAIRNEQFYILPQPEWLEAVRLRTDKLLRLENPQYPGSLIAKLVNPGRSS